jgi:hypothetical protein
MNKAEPILKSSSPQILLLSGRCVDDLEASPYILAHERRVDAERL